MPTMPEKREVQKTANISNRSADWTTKFSIQSQMHG